MAKPSRAKPAQDNKLIYIGPNLSGARLLKYQVFIGGYPSHLDAEFDACPNLRKLFVPVADFVAAEKLAKTAGTPLNKYYKEAMEV